MITVILTTCISLIISHYLPSLYYVDIKMTLHICMSLYLHSPLFINVIKSNINTDFARFIVIIPEVFGITHIRSTFISFLPHNTSVMRSILYYILSLYMYHMITVILTTCISLIISHYLPSLYYVDIKMTLHICMSLYLHSPLFINVIKSNINSIIPNGYLMYSI